MLRTEDIVSGILSTLILISTPVDIKYMIRNLIGIPRYYKYINS